MSSDKVESKGAQETTHSSSKDEDAKLDDTAGRDSTESSATEAAEPTRKRRSWVRRLVAVAVAAALLGLGYLALSIPHRPSALSKMCRALLAGELAPDAVQFVQSEGKDELVRMLSGDYEFVVQKDITPRNGVDRVVYNFRRLILSSVFPMKDEEFVTVVTMKDHLQSFRQGGRTVQSVVVLLEVDAEDAINVSTVTATSFFDKEDAQKVVAMFSEVVDDHTSEFGDKYNRLLQISALLMQYYDDFTRDRTIMSASYNKPYLVFREYNRFKQGKDYDYSKAEIEDLLRCYCYDRQPKMKQNAVDLAALVKRLEVAAKDEISSTGSYLTTQLLRVRSGMVDSGVTRKLLYLLLKGAPEGAKMHITEYLLEQEPMRVVSMLEGLTDGRTQVGLGAEAERENEEFIAMLANVYDETEYTSLKRQIIVTAHAMRQFNTDTVNTLIQKARKSGDDRLVNTVQYIEAQEVN